MRIRYKDRQSLIRIFRILIPIAFVVLCITPSWTLPKANELSSNEPDQVLDVDNEKVQTLVNPINTFDYAGTDYLKKDAVEEISQLIKDYYTASLSLDMDSMEWLVSDVDKFEYNKMRASLEYMESINNIICYTVEGIYEGTYRVYVYYDMKIRGIDTPAPALTAFYVTMSSDGEYIIYLSELDTETQDFIVSADLSEDVAILKALVDERFTSVVDSDPMLKEFCTLISGGNGTDTATGEAVKVD
ncbi:MAG: hypothetical protein E7265_01170 [Lachnospiraceae bacterium]|nr:hypothetical protein [Lachnospiraceae bacterium]